MLPVALAALLTELSLLGTVYSESQLATALDIVMETVKRHLTEGDHVQIPGLGGFQVSLSCPETRTPDATRAGSIKVKSVTYKPDNQLMRGIREKAVIQRVKFKKHSFRGGDMDSVMEHLREYFKTNRYITRKEMEEHCFLTRSTAINRLAKLVKDGILTRAGSDVHHPFYELVPGA